MAKSAANSFPPQIKYIVGNEAAERFSFYGMRAILTVFMTTTLLMQETEAVGVYHNFVAAVYFLPLLGAYLADRWWGKYKTIMRLSVVYCIGHLVLALFETKVGLMWGLGLVALGSGGIKPCVSAHVGDQFKAGQEAMLSKVFSLFYWMINFGAFFSQLLIPFTYKKYGSQVAFGIPGILMVIATIVFWMGRKYYVHVPPQGSNPHSFTKIVKDGFLGLLGGKGYTAAAKAKHPAKDVEGSLAVFKVIMVFVWVSAFWGLFDQSGSTWILQGGKMTELFVGIGSFGMNIDASQMQAVNPIMVMTLIPLFSMVIYPGIEKLGFKLTPLRKMTMGMSIAAFSFAAVALIQTRIEAGETLSIGYQIFPYLIITMAEVMISITGLEFAYTQAPRSMKSTIMSFWLLTTTLGNLLVSYITKLELAEPASASYFWIFTGIMAAVAVIFAIFAKFYKMQNYMEDDKSIKTYDKITD